MANACQSVSHSNEVWNSHGGFLLIILGVIALFWAISYICEEYSVPSICVFCKRNRIPDDVIGAILIGGILSLPVLTTSLFSTNVGIGTVIGGDIFNLFINVALSIYASPGKTIKLNAYYCTREMLMFLCSCILVLWSSREIDDSDHLIPLLYTSTDLKLSKWTRCMEIPWQSALILVSFYFLYCFLDAVGFPILLRWVKQFIIYFGWSESYSSLLLLGENEDTFSSVEDNYINPEIELVLNRSNDDYIECEVSQIESNDLITENSYESSNESGLTTFVSLQERQQQRLESLPIAILDVESFVQSTFQEYILQFPHLLESFPLYIRSSCYLAHERLCKGNRTEEMKNDEHVTRKYKWKLRYFTFNESGLFYKTDNLIASPFEGNFSVRYINVFQIKKIVLENESLFEFSIKIQSPSIPSNSNETNDDGDKNTKCRFYYFRASDRMIYFSVLHKLYWYYEKARTLSHYELDILYLKARKFISSPMDEIVNIEDQSLGETLFSIPQNAQWHVKIFLYLTFPLKYIFYWTIPDVRRQGSEDRALFSLLISCAWLGIFSYIVGILLSLLNRSLQIQESLITFTIGAWVASYPALWSSIVLSRLGFGQIAFYNAIGSNVFSNSLGLGIPWLIYCAATRNEGNFGFQEQGLAFSSLILFFIIALMYLLISCCSFTLKSWMIPILIIAYLVFIIVFSTLTVLSSS